MGDRRGEQSVRLDQRGETNHVVQVGMHNAVSVSHAVGYKGTATCVSITILVAFRQQVRSYRANYRPMVNVWVAPRVSLRLGRLVNGRLPTGPVFVRFWLF